MKPLLLLLLASLTAGAADREFREIVQAISDHYHTRPISIPFFGLVNAITFVARPAGTRHIDLAVFEDLDGTMEVGQLRRIVGSGWTPFVQTVSRRKGRQETTLIYMRPEGRDTRLLITTIDHSDATVVQLKLNMDALKRFIDEPGNIAWNKQSR